MNLKRILCRLVGHSWQRVSYFDGLDDTVTVGQCRRCGREAEKWEALSGHESPPPHLVLQKPENTIRARYMYNDDMTEEEFESKMESVLERRRR